MHSELCKYSTNEWRYLSCICIWKYPFFYSNSNQNVISGSNSLWIQDIDKEEIFDKVNNGTRMGLVNNNDVWHGRVSSSGTTHSPQIWTTLEIGRSQHLSWYTEAKDATSVALPSIYNVKPLERAQ